MIHGPLQVFLILVCFLGVVCLLSAAYSLVMSSSSSPPSSTVLPAHHVGKGLRLSLEERRDIGVDGLQPHVVLTLQESVALAWRILESKSTDFEKYIYLQSLSQTDTDTYYALILDHTKKIMPLIYTPTVGEGCEKLHLVYPRPRGLWISIKDKGRVKKVLENWPQKDIRVIVVTDGERILGLGDLGAHGMGIPVGKLALYTVCGGVPPDTCLPITLDVGTNNAAMLENPHYMGIREKRANGPEYYDFVDEFVEAVKELYPGVLLQWEDFGNTTAFDHLERYREALPSFNDDIQGTASVTLSGILSSLRVTGKTLTQMTFLFLGAGEAGTGIGHLIVSALKAQGMPEEEAKRHCWFVDSQGLVESTRKNLVHHKTYFAHDHEPLTNFIDVMHSVKPDAIIGVSGQKDSFNAEILQVIASLQERPVIFALSNPTTLAECTARDAIVLTEGRGLYGSGSPFPPVEYNGKTYTTGQGNNALVYPGIGLGVMFTKAKSIPDSVFLRAAQSLSDIVTEEELSVGLLFPDISRAREAGLAVAVGVAELIFDEGLSSISRPANLREEIARVMYDPRDY